MHCSHLICVQIRCGFHASSYSVATGCYSRLGNGGWYFSPLARLVLVPKLNNKWSYLATSNTPLWHDSELSATTALHIVVNCLSFSCVCRGFLFYFFSILCFHPDLCLERNTLDGLCLEERPCMCGRCYVAGYMYVLVYPPADGGNPGFAILCYVRPFFLSVSVWLGGYTNRTWK
jgi:hypothetical protein